MERYSRTQATKKGVSGSGPVLDWTGYGRLTGLEEPIWKLDNGGGGGGGGGQPESESESYPERPEMVDCHYYLRTGFCGFGSSCRFNHPRDRTAVTGAMKNSKGDYPERDGQPVCQYYMKTGKCKFGSSCKYHHPPSHGSGSSPTSTTLSIYGYPLRPGERECLYYVKTGQCKFGVTCKFDHPLPLAGVQVVVPQVHSSQHSWPISGSTLLSGSYVSGNYGPVLLQSGMVSVPGWSSYPAPVSPVSSANTRASIFSLTPLSPSAPAYTGTGTGHYISVSPSSDYSTNNYTNESPLPERPGQMECIYYMRTGVCKYGALCRFHHPPLSPPGLGLGLPLHPDDPTSSSSTMTDLKPDTFSTRASINSGGPVKSRSQSPSSRASSEINDDNDDVRVSSS